MAILVAVVGTFFGVFHLLNYTDENQTSFFLYHAEGMGFGYISGAEYLIEGTKEELLTFDGPKSNKAVEITDYSQKGTSAKVSCINHKDKDGYVDFPLLLYKGYHAYDQNTGKELPVEFGKNNLVRVTVPGQFQGEINIRFVSPLYWRLSEAVTVFMFVGTVVFSFVMWEKGKQGEGVYEEI